MICVVVGKDYPETTAEEPLMLFNKNNNNVSMPPEPEIPKFPVFPNIVSVENDASQAKVGETHLRCYIYLSASAVSLH